MGFKDYLKTTQSQINQELDRIFRAKLTETRQSKTGLISQEMVERLWQMSLKGKKIRGVLVKLAYESCEGRDKKAVLKAAAGIEILQSSILVFDDVMDRDEQRRRLPSMFKQFQKVGQALKVQGDQDWYGISMAVDVGVLALVMAYEVILNSGFKKDRVQAALAKVFYYCQLLSYGQALDITLLPWEKVNRQTVENIHYFKTASYTSIMPLLTGATLAGEKDKKRLKALETYGQALGLAFQIQDDILGVFGDSKTTGKPSGADLREAKRTLFLVDTIEFLKKRDQLTLKKFLKLIGKHDLTEKEINWLKKTIKQTKALEQSLRAIDRWQKKAQSQISQITDKPELQSVYLGLVEFVGKRKK